MTNPVQADADAWQRMRDAKGPRAVRMSSLVSGVLVALIVGGGGGALAVQAHTSASTPTHSSQMTPTAADPTPTPSDATPLETADLEPTTEEASPAAEQQPANQEPAAQPTTVVRVTVPAKTTKAAAPAPAATTKAADPTPAATAAQRAPAITKPSISGLTCARSGDRLVASASISTGNQPVTVSWTVGGVASGGAKPASTSRVSAWSTGKSNACTLTISTSAGTDNASASA